MKKRIGDSWAYISSQGSTFSDNFESNEGPQKTFVVIFDEPLTRKEFILSLKGLGNCRVFATTEDMLGESEKK